MKNVALVSREGLRLDGRYPDEIRDCCCTLERSVLGNASFSMGGSQVIGEVKHGSASSSGGLSVKISVGSLLRGQYSGNQLREWGWHLENVLGRVLSVQDGEGLHSLSSGLNLQVFLHAIAADGSLFSCLVNCACAALVKKAVPMVNLFAAVSVGRVSHSGRILTRVSGTRGTDDWTSGEALAGSSTRSSLGYAQDEMEIGGAESRRNGEGTVNGIGNVCEESGCVTLVDLCAVEEGSLRSQLTLVHCEALGILYLDGKNMATGLLATAVLACDHIKEHVLRRKILQSLKD